MFFSANINEFHIKLRSFLGQSRNPQNKNLRQKNCGAYMEND